VRDQTLCSLEQYIQISNDYSSNISDVNIGNKEFVDTSSPSDDAVKTVMEITAFQDTTAIIASKPNLSTDPAEVKMEVEHTINNFVNRPFYVDEYTFSPSNAVNDILATIDFPTGFVNKMYNCKLEGHRFFRADVKIMFKINAPTMSKGRLLAYYAPFQSSVGTYSTPNNIRSGSGYPCVELDMGTQTSVSLTIPYVSPLSAYDQITDNGNMGTLKLIVLSPYGSTSTTYNAKIGLYCHYSNINLRVPSYSQTSALAIAQGEAMLNSAMQLLSNNKPIVGAVSKMVDRRAPKMSGLLNDLPWYMGIAGKALTAFGLSKTQDLEKSHAFKNAPLDKYCNSEGVDMSTMLALKPDNALGVDPSLFRSSVDEMDLKHLCTKQSFLTNASWSTTDAVGAPIMLIPITPAYSSDITEVGQVFTPTLIHFISSYFQLWRGSLKYRFSVVKNQFYSGRLRFVLFSGLNVSDLTSTFLEEYIDFFPSYVCNFQTNNDVVVEVPFVFNQKFCRVDQTGGTLNQTNSIGTLGVIVELELKPAQDSIPPSVDVLCFIGAGDDFSLAYPAFNSLIPKVTDVPVIPPPPITSASTCIAQSGAPSPLVAAEAAGAHSEQDRKESYPSQTILKFPKTDFSSEAYCVGESCLSLRSLTKRFSFLKNYPLGFFPLGFDTGQFSPNSTLLESISFLYRFYAGSRRYKFIVTKHPKKAGLVPSNLRLVATLLPNIEGDIQAPAPITLTVSPYQSSPSALTFVDLNPVLEITVPFYHSTPIDLLSSQSMVTSVARPAFCISWLYDGMSEADEQGAVDVLVAAGDDFSFGYQVGPPNVVRSSLF